jgi:hypothetical protein
VAFAEQVISPDPSPFGKESVCPIIFICNVKSEGIIGSSIVVSEFESVELSEQHARIRKHVKKANFNNLFMILISN